MTSPHAISRGRGALSIPAPGTPAPPPDSGDFPDPTDPNFQKKVTEEWVRGGQELLKNFTPDKLVSLIPKIFAESDFQVSASFQETAVVLPDSFFDLAIAEGATICFGLRGKDSLLSVPYPISLRGFSASAWIFGQPLDKVVADEAGNVGVSSPCFDKALKDITPEIMASPLGELFPSQKVAAVPFGTFARFAETFLRKASSSGSATSAGPMQGMIDHLDRMSVSALIYQSAKDRPSDAGYLFSWDGGICHASAASVHAVFSVPRLKENIQKKLYESFDFQGLEELAIHWPHFPIQDLVPAEDLKVISGDISLDVQGASKGESLEMTLRFRESKLVWEKLFGPAPIEMNGAIRIVLKKGGTISLEPKDLSIRVPVFPSARHPLFSFSGILDGPVSLHRDTDGSVYLQNSKLTLRDFALTAKEESPLSLKGLGKLLSGHLEGQISLSYDAWHPFQNFNPTFDLKGALNFAPQDGKGISKISLEDLHSKGSLSFAHGGGKLEPNFSTSSFTLGTKLSLERNEKELLSAENLSIAFKGGERKEIGKEIQQSATLSLGADGLYAGQFAWVPGIFLDIQTRHDAKSFSLAAQGVFDLASIEPKKKLNGDATIIPPFTDISLPFSISTDGESMKWQIETKRPQVVGPVTLDGELKVVGEQDYFQMTTTAPLTVSVHNKAVVRGLTVKGSRDEKKTAFALQAASVGDVLRGGIWFRPVGDRLSGAYQFSPLAKALPGGKSLSVKDAQVKGSFSTPDLEQMLEKPRVYIKGVGQARLAGEANGDVKIDYNATLLYQPAVQRPTSRGPREFPPNIQLVFSRSQDSRIEFGPFLAPDGKELFKGNAKLKGSLSATPREGVFTFGGNDIGITEGAVFFGNQTDPVLSALTIDASQLWGIRNGTAFGKSIRAEADLNLAPLLEDRVEGTDPQALKRHVKWIVDRQPLTVEAFWKLVKAELERSDPGGGPTP